MAPAVVSWNLTLMPFCAAMNAIDAKGELPSWKLWLRLGRGLLRDFATFIWEFDASEIFTILKRLIYASCLVSDGVAYLMGLNLRQ